MLCKLFPFNLQKTRLWNDPQVANPFNCVCPYGWINTVANILFLRKVVGLEACLLTSSGPVHKNTGLLVLTWLHVLSTSTCKRKRNVSSLRSEAVKSHRWRWGRREKTWWCPRGCWFCSSTGPTALVSGLAGPAPLHTCTPFCPAESRCGTLKIIT